MNEDDTWPDRIVHDPDVHGGVPRVCGARVRVPVIGASLAEVTDDQLLRDYPSLTRDDVAACPFYASDAVRAAHGPGRPNPS